MVTSVLPAPRMMDAGASRIEAAFVEQSSLSIAYSGQQLVALLCSPGDPQYPAVGFVPSQRSIRCKEDISMRANKEKYDQQSKS